MRCPERYPDGIGQQCRLEEDQPHAQHFAGYGDNVQTWDNTAYNPEPVETKPVSNRSKLFAIAKRLRSGS